MKPNTLKFKFLKLIILIIVSLFLTIFINGNLDLDYSSMQLKADIEIFENEEVMIADKKMYILPNYRSISEHFDPKSFAKRLMRNIEQKNLICKRDKQSEKRSIRIKSKETSISLSIVFSNKENAVKCDEQIRNYVEYQKDLYLKESQNLINFAKYRKFSKIQEDELKLEEITNLDLSQDLKNYLMAKSFYSSYINMEQIEEYFSLIKSSNIFQIKSEVMQSEGFRSLYSVQYLFGLIVTLVSLIIFRKEINYFKKKIFKN